MQPKAALESQAVVTASASPKIVKAESLLKSINDIYSSIARRAFELYESRDRAQGHDLEDWFRAEAELLRPVPVEITKSNDHLRVRAEVGDFSATDIEVCVKPRVLIISGRYNQTAKQQQGETSSTERRADQILRVLNLSTTVDSNKPTATLTDGVLNLILPILGEQNGGGEAEIA